MKKLIILLLAVTLLGATLAGCGPKETQETTTTATTATTTTEATTTRGKSGEIRIFPQGPSKFSVTADTKGITSIFVDTDSLTFDQDETNNYDDVITALSIAVYPDDQDMQQSLANDITAVINNKGTHKNYEGLLYQAYTMDETGFIVIQLQGFEDDPEERITSIALRFEEEYKKLCDDFPGFRRW